MTTRPANLLHALKCLQSVYGIAIITVTVVLVTPLVTYAITAVQARCNEKTTGREPPVAPYWIPYVGHLLSFLINPGKLVKSLRKKYPNTPFTIIMFGTKFHVFSSAKVANMVFSKSRDFLFHPIVASMMENGIALPAEDQPMFNVPIEPYSRDSKARDTFVESNHSIYIKYLTGKNLDATMQVYKERFIDHVKRNFVLEDGNAWTRIKLHKEMQKTVFFGSAETFFGDRLQQMYPGLWDDWQLLNDALYIGVRSNMAFWLQPRAMRARSRMLKIFDKWVQRDLENWDDEDPIWREKWGCRLNWERERLLREHNFSIRGRSCSQASFLWVIITNAAPMATWFILCVIRSPEILSRFRQEAIACLLPNGNNELELGFDMARLRSNAFLNALWKEALRLGSASSAARIVGKDVEIEGHLLKKGSLVLLPVQLMHFEPDVFEDPEQFKPERWMTSEKEEDNPAITEKQRLQNSFMRPFGGGSGMCSGRFIAEQEVLFATATLLLRFDIELEPGQNLECNPRALGIMSPAKDPWVRIRKRPNPTMA